MHWATPGRVGDAALPYARELGTQPDRDKQGRAGQGPQAAPSPEQAPFPVFANTPGLVQLLRLVDRTWEVAEMGQ